jgi:hypothetical protein
MTVNFPAVQPTACAFTPPEFPFTTSVSQSGVRSYRLWGNKASDALLDIEFRNISEANGAAILNAFKQAKGPIEPLTIPSIIFSGVSNSTLIAELSQAGASWYFDRDNPPTVERVPGRRVSVAVKLRTELRIQ